MGAGRVCYLVAYLGWGGLPFVFHKLWGWADKGGFNPINRYRGIVIWIILCVDSWKVIEIPLSLLAIWSFGN